MTLKEPSIQDDSTATLGLSSISQIHNSFISSEKFKDFPKAIPMKNNRASRQSGCCMIATDTPKKKELENAKNIEKEERNWQKHYWASCKTKKENYAKKATVFIRRRK